MELFDENWDEGEAVRLIGISVSDFTNDAFYVSQMNLFDEKDAIDFAKANLVSYIHGEYYNAGKFEGFFGYSVAGEDALKRRMKK